MNFKSFLGELAARVRGWALRAFRWIRRLIVKARLLFEAALARIIERARGYALKLLGDQDDADEAVAQALFRIVRLSDPPERFEAYLFRAVRNAALDILRRRKRHRATRVDIDAVAGELEDNSPTLAEQFTRAQEAGLVSAALARLATIERNAVRVHYYWGLSLADTAERLGVDLFMAQNVLVRARRKLGRTLGPMLLA